MKDKILKITGVLSLILAVGAIIGAAAQFAWGKESTGWLLIGLSVLGFFLGKFIIKITRPPNAFYKLFHTMILIVKYLHVNKINEESVKQILFLIDYQSSLQGERMFHPLVWKMSSGRLSLPLTVFSLKTLNRMKALKSQGADVTMMVPYLSLTPSELSLVIDTVTAVDKIELTDLDSSVQSNPLVSPLKGDGVIPFPI